MVELRIDDNIGEKKRKMSEEEVKQDEFENLWRICLSFNSNRFVFFSDINILLFFILKRIGYSPHKQ